MQAVITIRPERSDDIHFTRNVNLLAFGRPVEANLVDELRRNGKLIVSLVAETESLVVGHIGFSVVASVNAPDVSIAGLAPVSVLPEFQRRSVGSMLVRQGIEQCRRIGVQAIVVIGHPDYYPRFDFRRASRFGLTCVYGAPDEAFMAMELVEGALSACCGMVHYQPEFNAFE
jgi:putative acetyltransferase